MINSIRLFTGLNEVYLIKLGMLPSVFPATCILTVTSHPKVKYVRMSDLLAIHPTLSM